MTTERNVDFPAFGSPTIPQSASNFNSKTILFVTPGKPFSATLGHLFLDDLKQALPLPPRPPFATTNSSPSFLKSYKT